MLCCVLRRRPTIVSGCLPHGFCDSRNGGVGGGGWGHPQGAEHMATARLGCKGAMGATGLANSHPGCMSMLVNATPTLYGVHFWQKRLFGFQTGIC